MTTEHTDTSHLIAEYCNNRLSAREKAEFEQRLQKDHELSAACNEFRRFQALYRQVDPVELAPSAALFARISDEIAALPRGAGKRPAWSRRLAGAVSDFWQRFREPMPWVLAAAQAVVIALLLVPAPQQNIYSTLSTAGVAADDEMSRINVVFRPESTESDIRSLLHTIQGSVSSGPSREGRYVVSIGSPSDLDTVVRTLQESTIVLFADPVR